MLWEVIFIFLIGACCGSYFKLCADRIPQGKSTVFPYSACEFCNKKIPWYYNIPILSWVYLRGKSVCCQKKIPAEYVWVELGTAVLFSFLWGMEEFKEVFKHLLLVSLLIPASLIDWKHLYLPDRYTLGGVIAGGVWFLFFNPQNFVEICVKGILLGSSVLLWIGIFSSAILKKEALGFGDIKLIGCIGAFLGPIGALFSIFGGAVIGTCLLALIHIGSRIFYLRKRIKQLTWGQEIPFAPLLSLGAMSYIFLQQPIQFYFRILGF